MGNGGMAVSEIRPQPTTRPETSSERHARVREEAANAEALAANLVGTCKCVCHTAGKHCETCCQHQLCTDCIYYSIGG